MKWAFMGWIAVVVLGFVGWIGAHEYWLASGPVVRLATRPIDPRSLFMGHYVALRYEISDIPVERFPMSQRREHGFRDGGPIYVALRPTLPYATLVSATYDEPAIRQPGLVYLRGQLRSSSDSTVAVDYGLDRYYIPESRQEEVGGLFRTGSPTNRVAVEVAVLPSGVGTIKRLLVDGRPWPP